MPPTPSPSPAPLTPTPTAVPPTPTPTTEPLPSPTERPVPSASIDGYWEGALLIGATLVDIVVEFETTDDGGVRATIDIPAQGIEGLALDRVALESSRVHLEISQFEATFDGELVGDEISGAFEQPGVSGTFSLSRGEAPSPAVQAGPPPYTEEEVTFKNGDVTLAGTLTLPPGAGPHPAVVLITGSGPQNRDEEIVGFKIFRVMADHLTRVGIAVLRYDDRGVGGSTGDVNQSTLVDFAADVAAAIELLKDRSDVSPTQIGLIGHSEGGVVAPMVASGSNDVAFVVLIAGTGVPGDQLLTAQLEAILQAEGATEEDIERQLSIQGQSLDAVRMDAGWTELETAIRAEVKASIEMLPEAERASITDVDTVVDNATQQQLTTLQSPWFRSFLEHDPAPVLEELATPVLAILGERDVQVPWKLNSPAIKTALENGGNEDFNIEVLPEANHLFQAAVTGSISEYATLDKRFVPGFLETIADWIVARVNLSSG